MSEEQYKYMVACIIDDEFLDGYLVDSLDDANKLLEELRDTEDDEYMIIRISNYQDKFLD